MGGQFAATAHAEADLSIGAPDTLFERLGDVTLRLAEDEVRWEAEKARLAAESEARTIRRRRLAGARAASRLLSSFPGAVSVTYSRDPRNGLVAMESIDDHNGQPIYTAEDSIRGILPGNHREQDRRVSSRQGVRQLMGTTPPPDHGAQGITILDDGRERLHLQTALDDGLDFLEAEELTPDKAAAQRVEAALSQWNDQGEDLHTRVRDMLTDLRHFATAYEIDLGEAFDHSYEVFLEEHHDPAFKEGI